MPSIICWFPCLLTCSIAAPLLAPNQSGSFISGSEATEPCRPHPESPNIGDRSLCTFERNVDRNVGRIPPEIPTVTCRCRDDLCTRLGDFRCHEVKEVLQVAHRVGNTLRNETLRVTTACICASNRSVQAPGSLGRPLNIGDGN